jgi:hypothetical protein
MTTLTAPLVGMKYHTGAAEALEQLGFGSPLTLQREPENVHDENAIMVFSEETFLGYIAREYASDWAPTFDSDGIPPAKLTFSSEGRPRVEIESGEATEEPPEEEGDDDALSEGERGAL